MNANIREYDTVGIMELDSTELDLISGGHPAALAATAIVALGSSSLEFGRKLGGAVYRILH